MKKFLIAIFSLVFVASCSEDEISNDSSIVVISNLSDLNDGDEKLNIKRLTINGTISGEDWNILFEMATMGSLELLDMTNARIVGDDVYGWNENEIPEYKFSHSKTLKEVYLPNSLKTIGTESFAECSKLIKVHFPESIDSIAPRAFYKSGITGELELPSHLRIIGRQAFGWTKVKKVVIASDIVAGKTIIQKENEDGIVSDYSSIYAVGGNSVFAYCENLSDVIVKDGCTMLEIGFQHCQSLSNVLLPHTLRSIGSETSSNGNYVFQDCIGLKEIDLPKNLKFIGHDVFSNTSLNEIVIPDNVQYLFAYAFHKCTQLTKVKMSTQLKEISYGCFEACTSLTEIEIPDMVTNIDDNAFADCSSLTTVQFGNKIKTIGGNAFAGCILLQSAVLPSSLSILRKCAFEGCSGLVRVVLPDYIEEIESSTFRDCIELQDVYIGKAVLKVGSSAFFHCPKLEIVNLPNSITEINDYAFAYTGLKEFRVTNETPLSINSNIFNGINLLKATLIVPFGTKEQYLLSSTWKEFGQIIEL